MYTPASKQFYDDRKTTQDALHTARYNKRYKTIAVQQIRNILIYNITHKRHPKRMFYVLPYFLVRFQCFLYTIAKELINHSG